jgi:hypothetical protein
MSVRVLLLQLDRRLPNGGAGIGPAGAPASRSRQKMNRHIVLLVVALGCGCFNEPGSTTTHSGVATSSPEGSSTAPSSSSTANDSDSGVAEGVDASGTTSLAESSEGVVGSTGDDLPEPRAVWRFDGDFVEDIVGADGVAEGRVSFVASPTGMAAGPLVLASVGAVSTLVRVRLDDLTGDQVLWSLGKAGNAQAPADNSFALALADGVLQVFTETGAGGINHTAVLGPVVPAGDWVTLVVTVDADTVRAYVDGAPGPSAFYVPPETTASDFYIGGFANPDSPTLTESLHGAIDELRIWDVVLDDEQVLAVSAR